MTSDTSSVKNKEQNMEERIGICSYIVTIISPLDKSKETGHMETLTADWLQTLIADTISQSMSQKMDDSECPRTSVRRTMCSTTKVQNIPTKLISMNGPERRQAYYLLSQMNLYDWETKVWNSQLQEYNGSEQTKPSKEMVAWTMRAISLGDHISPRAVSELIEAVKLHGCE